MSGGSSSGSSYMTTEQASNAAGYIQDMNSILSQNASVEEYKYQAQVLRDNKAIYDEQAKLSAKSITDSSVGDINILGAQYQAKQVDSQYNQMGVISSVQGQIQDKIGAQAETELGMANAQAKLTLELNNDLATKLYNIRFHVERDTSKVVADFANRGLVGNPASMALVSEDLADRQHRANLAKNYAGDMLSLTASQNASTTQLQRANLAKTIDSALANTAINIAGQQADLNEQMNVYKQQTNAITTKANNDVQQTYYNSVVKAYQDETQATLLDYKAATGKTIANQSLLAANLKIAAKTSKTGRVEAPEGYNGQ